MKSTSFYMVAYIHCIFTTNSTHANQTTVLAAVQLVLKFVETCQ